MGQVRLGLDLSSSYTWNKSGLNTSGPVQAESNLELHTRLSVLRQIVRAKLYARAELSGAELSHTDIRISCSTPSISCYYSDNTRLERLTKAPLDSSFHLDWITGLLKMTKLGVWKSSRMERRSIV